ncbi:rhodanese-related sulfurtransferase [Candidatus Rickettsiella viridis]|uniref:Rhodanese-related sulfurtransferase n=1 Tax=Candidatus Rickettsiella viridis TaxID=676208 RepID=A0A2Z5UUC4_9COXI|nr:rhodanese-like domain-containing protein [Candidatus Rickettsiella viridis]BBB14550.1 rhodanese-related sulfurtransferase [Candidatus Rickettsiella viridis]
MLSIINISAYRFVRLSHDLLAELQIKLKKETQQLGLKGTILLSEEGINLFLAGQREAITEFQEQLNRVPALKNLTFKESLSDFQPFKKMFVKLKKEIIPFGIDAIRPEIRTATSIAPETLKSWFKERPNLVLLDTRNSFEVEFGSFENSLHLELKHFRDFPTAVQKLPDTVKKAPVVTFCTGGIRCEKASAFLLEAGFDEVYQLEGGILNYFEKCGGDHYDGLCFVFDDRKTLTPSLEVFDSTKNP